MARKLQAALMVLTLMAGCNNAAKEEAANVTSPAKEESLRLQRYVAAKAAYDEANKQYTDWRKMRKDFESQYESFKKIGDEQSLKLAEESKARMDEADALMTKFSEKASSAKKMMDENNPVPAS